jgi:AraC-like DNA-binding protein
MVLFGENGSTLAQIAGGSWDFKHGHVIRRHSHREDQLLFASSGVMTADTEEGVWVVPPLRAVWIPAGTKHSILMSGRVSMRTLYFLPRLCATLPRKAVVINVSSLLRELILHACSFLRLRKQFKRERHVIDLILDQLRTAESIPVQLPRPSDPRAKKLVEILFTDPADSRALEELASACGSSKRTMQRLFANETGMSFGRWRQRLRFITAMQHLAAGGSVTEAALEAGYSTPSAFISMFRKQVGTSPTRYLSRAAEEVTTAFKIPAR